MTGYSCRWHVAGNTLVASGKLIRLHTACDVSTQPPGPLCRAAGAVGARAASGRRAGAHDGAARFVPGRGAAAPGHRLVARGAPGAGGSGRDLTRHAHRTQARGARDGVGITGRVDGGLIASVRRYRRTRPKKGRAPANPGTRPLDVGPQFPKTPHRGWSMECARPRLNKSAWLHNRGPASLLLVSPIPWSTTRAVRVDVRTRLSRGSRNSSGSWPEFPGRLRGHCCCRPGSALERWCPGC
jgi:hypothetical protein